MNRSSKALFAVAVLAAGACKADKESAADSASAFCTDWLAAVITHEYSCRAAAASYLERSIANLPASCELIHRSVLEGRMRFDRAMSAECATWLETTYASTPCDAATPEDPVSCRQVFRPLVPTGGACTQPAECIGGWCSFPEGSCPRPGVCVPIGGEGEPCDSVQILPAWHESCQPGLECDSSWTCRVPVARVGEGATCGVSSSCKAGLYCRGFRGLQDSVCQPLVGLGEPCPEIGACARGLVCNRYRTCAQYVGEGSSCAEDTVACGDGLFCNDAHECEAYPENGAPCSPELGCVDGYCSTVDSLCHPWGKAGDACSETELCDCYSQTCNAGVCEPMCPGW